MDDKAYILRYLPLFEKDLAALRLINDTEIVIQRRLANPLSFEPLRSIKNRKHPYYPIYIRNYMVLYVVIDDVMEVRRFVYSRRDLTRLR